MSFFPDNFEQVDGHVFRGARPSSPAQIDSLFNAGVREFINLEWEESDNDFTRRGIELVRIKDFEPLPYFAPSLADEHVVRALRAIRALERQRVYYGAAYVHCRSGQNRTGVVIAAYRLILRGENLIDPVLADFDRFRGFWARADRSYIRSLLPRRNEFIRRIES